jgi:hypothetical protein
MAGMFAKGRLRLAMLGLMILLAAGGLWWGLSTRGARRVLTAEGYAVTLKSVTFGQTHRHVYGQWWSKPLALLFPTNPPAWCKTTTFQITNDMATLVCWVEGSGAAGTMQGLARFGPLSACVTDASGLESAPVSPVRSLAVSNRWFAAYEFTSFPRRAEHCGLRLYRSTPSNRVERAEFRISNPARRSYPEWAPEALPATKKAGHEPISLATLHTGLYHGLAFMSNHVGTWTEVELDYPNGPWTILAVELSDATGNRVRKQTPTMRMLERDTRVSSEAVAAWSRRHAAISLEGALWLEEAAWRIHLECRQGWQAVFPADQLWTVQGLAVPGASGVTAVNARTNVGGVALAFTALSASNEVRQGQCRRIQALVRVDSPPPGAFVDIVKLTDDRGTNLFKAPARFETRQHVLDLRVPPESKTVDITFAVHRKQTVEFTVAPTLLRTNIVRSDL